MLDQGTFAEYVRAYHATVFMIALGRLRNKADAEDVTQNVFLALLRTNKEFQSDDHVKNWLVHVTLNECASAYRAARHAPENIDNYVDSLVAPDPQNRELLRSMLKLPKKYATVLYLYYYEEYDTNQIAELMDIPAATVRTRIARGRKRLCEALEGGCCQ